MNEIEEKKEFRPKPLQMRFAEIYLNPTVIMTRDQIAKELGINRRTIYNWLQIPEFKEWLYSRRMELINNSLIDIYRVAVDKARRGDYNFCRLILEMSGEYTPGMKVNTSGVQELIKIEVVQSQQQAQKQGEK